MTQPNEIVGTVDGQKVVIINRDPRRDAHELDRTGWMMADVYIGDHLLKKPALLRQMVADNIARAIRLGRDAGYRQALAEVRAVLGIKN